MAWDNYHGQHRLNLLKTYPNTYVIRVTRLLGSTQYASVVATCELQASGLWRHSAGAVRKPIYGDFKTLLACVKDAVRANGMWIGLTRVRDL